MELNDKSAIRMAFIPRNKTFIGFTGDLYISNDDKYTVLRADLGITKDISLNFVRDLQVIQEFEEVKGVNVLTKDNMTLDLAATEGAMGIYANRSNIYDNYDFSEPDKAVYKGNEKIITRKDAYEKGETYWQNSRLQALTEKEAGIYKMVDTLVTIPTYKRFVFFTKFVALSLIHI